MNGDELAVSIFNTIRYFDIFEQPLTATQIWRTLLVSEDKSHVRWAGHPVYRLQDIVHVLATSPFLNQKVESEWGYYFLKGKKYLVKERLKRHALAQGKWKLTLKVVRWLALAPFVRMIAMSGSLSEGNTRESSDLDLFLVVRRGRIWLARLWLMLIAQLTGRRRKYWDRQAPDKVCLNHYITDDELVIQPEIRNLYTAVAYHHHIPLFGLENYAAFQRANSFWIKKWLMFPEAPILDTAHQVRFLNFGLIIKRGIEYMLAEPIFDWLEYVAERWQRSSIFKHTQPGRLGRVAMSNNELAFHPDSKVPGILERFAQDADQKAFW